MKSWLPLVGKALVSILLITCFGLFGDLGPTAEGAYGSNHAASAEVVSPVNANLDNQWALGKTGWLQVWPVTSWDTPSVVVAVLDTGIDRDHEDLIGEVVAEVNFSDSPVADDLHGHGTHIAGIIAADADNGVGINGLAPGSLLMNVKVADDRGRCDAEAVAAGIVWAVDNGANILNISLCLSEPSQALEEAIAYAWSHGAVIIAAAGNSGDSAPQYPAYYHQVIAVTATREDGSRAPLASYGDWVDVAAPGYQIYSTLPDNEYGYKTGTSQAAAYVTGLAAFLYSIATDSDGDGWVNDEVRSAIESSCQQIDGSGMGNGLVDWTKAVSQLQYYESHPQSPLWQPGNETLHWPTLLRLFQF